MHDSTPSAAMAEGASRFELAPPRRFILPAILLLLTEQPGYGYELVARLEGMHFGHVDRPAVYRALARLEQDGLVEATSQSATAGQARRVYRATGQGERVLRVWMGVIKEEHEYLVQVIRRYQATGTTDAVLAEVEGGWSSALGVGWSPVSSSFSGRRRLMAVDADGAQTCDLLDTEPAEPPSDPMPQRFRLDPDRSAVLIDVRSTVGPISFGTIGLSGFIEAAMIDGALHASMHPTGSLTIDVTTLRSGNHLYDSELLRRINARRFPNASVELLECTPVGTGPRYKMSGQLTFHGMTRPAEGSVSVESISDDRILVIGEQAFDIRDFAVPSPTVLMLRIYPDIRVRLHAEAELERDS